ncbi:MAG: deoxyguanosinetriphosphate triphosphohydrolase [Alphaproteobacteria bacterium]|nr:deoxyguanosinetriphosphate triphosphohydrolase [Alphaproteobacteria bacterium]
MLASYAAHPAASRGRLHTEAEDQTRSCFQRDRDRVIHSTAFRRLEYKTQVFVNHEGDHYRTRLTHSLEVAQIARSLARALALNEDLTEALALAHDLGHPPFGHAGEDGLRAAMADFGGFDHNAHSIRIVTKLEQRYAAFDGLNLTWEALEGIAKHNGPVANAPRALAKYNREHDLELDTWPSAEAQVASLADDIAYNNHDLDDGLRAELFHVEELSAVPEVYAAFTEVRRHWPHLEQARLIHEALRRLINRMCMDALATTRAALAATGVQSADEVRQLGRPLVEFSAGMQEINKQLKRFLSERMYRHYKVNRMSSKARRVTRELFDFFLAEPECLPTDWRALAPGPRTAETAHVVCDFIAGMTDRYALEEHRRIFDVNARG